MNNFTNNQDYFEKIENLALEHNIPYTFFEINDNTYFICGFDTNDILENEPALYSLITFPNSYKLSDYDIAIFNVSNCEQESIYTQIKDYCETLELLAPIYTNKYICDLDSAVQNFGLTGTYVVYEKDIDSDFRGVYFVCGSDTNKVLNEEINIRKIISDSQKNDDFFHHKIQAFYLTDAEPFTVHQQIIEYCRNVEFINNLYKEYNKQIPDTVSYAGLISMKMLYVNSRNPEMHPLQRAEYERALLECFDNEDVYHSKDNPEYEKYKFMTDGHHDITKSNVENWFRRKFGQNNNQVSLEQVFMSSPANVARITLNITLADKVQKELNKRPDIIYWMSKPQGVKLEFDEGQGFDLTTGKADTRTVEFAFSEIYRSDIHDILNKICYPEAFKLTAQEMSKKAPIDIVQIPDTEYKNFVSLCQANNVAFCIDNHIKKQPAGQLNMVYFKHDEEMIDAILTRLSIESEEFHVALEKPKDTPVSQITGPNGESLDDKLNSIIAEKFPDKNFTIIGGSFDDLR